MTAMQRKIMALTLSGKGVEVCAGSEKTALPSGASAKHVTTLTTEQHRKVFGERAPAVDVRIRDLNSAWVGPQAKRRPNFVILNSEAITCSPNPIGLISAWSDRLAMRGQLIVAFPGRGQRAVEGRPVTPIEHLYSDLKRRRTTACDEHRLASAFADNPNQFPDPSSVGLALAYLWALRLYELDDKARSLLGAANEKYLAKLAADPAQKIRHHVFSARSVLAMMDIVNAEANFQMAPYDMTLGDSEGEEDLVAFRRFEKPALKSRQGQSGWTECTTMFQRQAAAFAHSEEHRPSI